MEKQTSTQPIRLIANPKFCRRHGISETFAFRLRRDGVLPYLVLGGRIFYDEDEVERVLDSLRHRGPRFGMEVG